MTSVSNMSDHKKPDYLSLLPPELLDDIFEKSHDYKSPITTPLSKSLLPFQERLLFPKLTARSYQSLERLCMIAQRRPEALVHARFFSVSIDRETGTKDMAKEVKDVGTPSNKLVKLLFRKMPKLTTSSFPNLTFLTLASTFRTTADPFHPALYTSLQYYSELEFVTIVVWRTPKSIQPYEKPLPQILPFLSKVVDVSLDGPLSASLPSVKALLFSFGVLFAISLTDTSKTARIYHLIDGLFEPEELQSLSLALPQHNQASRPVPSDLVKLTKLTSLEFLSFGGRATPGTFSLLQALPLISLTFEPDAQVSLSELTKLVTGDTKHKTLKGLELNNVAGMVGTRIEDEQEPYYDVDCDMIDVYPDWILPDWTDEFDEDGLVKFVTIAEKEGIEVEGTAVEAIGIEDEFDEEQAILADYEEGFEELDGCG
ncbi:hypothetical protein JCM5353_003268 [Sporobolomyces roseus]